MRFLLLLLCTIPFLALGQTDYDMDELARNVPKSSVQSVDQLAHYFVHNIPDERGRVRAIFAWITLNIKYLDRSNRSEIWATPEHLDLQRPEQVLKNRTAVCQGFANLFQALAHASGMQSQVVTGIVKNEDREVMRIGHAWVAVEVRGEWQLFDPTWSVPRPGEGWQIQEKYFMMAPSKFVLNHLPDDPAWQLLEHPLRESDFRENDDEGISTLLQQKNEPVFNFRDTLDHWIVLDSISRSFSAESRILAFNGDNQRVVFGLGQGYWGLFFDLRAHLDSLCNRSIMEDSILLDTAYVLAQIKQMQKYHERARQLFSQITEPERLAQAQKFHNPQDVLAITDKIRGSMWTAVFENQCALTQQNIGEPSLKLLQSISDAADQAYLRAQNNINCVKLSSVCFSIWHNLSLVHLQLAERYSLYAQNLTGDKNGGKYLPTIEAALQHAKTLFSQAETETRQLLLLPPPYAFVQERLSAALKGLLTVKLRAISARRLAITPRLEAKSLSGRNILDLSENLKAIVDDLVVLTQETEDAYGKFDDEFCSSTLFNLHNEGYNLRFNLSRLYYLAALQQYTNAVDNHTLNTDKKRIELQAQQALPWLKEANQSLDFLKKSNRAPRTSIDQRIEQTDRLSKSIREFLAEF